MNKTDCWNSFISHICFQEFAALNPIQTDAVMCFWYDSEVNSGGHSGFFDIYPDMDLTALEAALRKISNSEIADNFHNAIAARTEDAFSAADDAFYSFTPQLADYLEDFVFANKESIFP